MSFWGNDAVSEYIYWRKRHQAAEKKEPLAVFLWFHKEISEIWEIEVGDQGLHDWQEFAGTIGKTGITWKMVYIGKSKNWRSQAEIAKITQQEEEYA